LIGYDLFEKNDFCLLFKMKLFYDVNRMNSGKGKGQKGQGEEGGSTWTPSHDAKLKEATKDHAKEDHAYGNILKDPKYSQFFKDWNRGQLRV
jgi:hypothetical protein